MVNALQRCDFDSDNLILRLQRTLPADVRQITPVVEAVMAMVTQMGCAAGHEFEVETALREALANAIVHGCGGDARKEIEFCIACDEARGMLIVVRDPGPGFDARALPSPVLGREVFSTHGRGIFLINQLMDQVHFEKGGAEIYMVKR